LGDIFKPTREGRPIAGSGECAAPKLFQYAFQHDLHPIALAEFWWGESPKTEVRIHGHYYPACRGKCEPILGFMLQGLAVEENPMLKNPAENKDLEVVWEDAHIVVINKPAEFLSVPGKLVTDSVYERMRMRYPEATGPLIVHRLDMSTSGLLLVAKTAEVHKELQRQFIQREIKKRYVALLEGEVLEDRGTVELPLRVDLENRPRQLVCYEYGKPAVTIWKVLERKDGRTRIHFFPITGRTHQLRVHAAHVDGLHAPIVGDDLYGQTSHRLHLHAEWIQFRHPISGKDMTMKVEAGF
jgi:tRNA pseudouridine32 synthase / 23S rRNA pseudouridine746 synthase